MEKAAKLCYRANLVHPFSLVSPFSRPPCLLPQVPLPSSLLRRYYTPNQISVGHHPRISSSDPRPYLLPQNPLPLAIRSIPLAGRHHTPTQSSVGHPPRYPPSPPLLRTYRSNPYSLTGLVRPALKRYPAHVRYHTLVTYVKSCQDHLSL